MNLHFLRWLGLLLLLGATVLAYRPGLSGGFLFDDFANLPALSAMGPVQDSPSFWRYVTSGSADPTGRPLALLSFLVDARSWPADPAPFLRTNLLLHLLNGALLFALLLRLGRHLGTARAPAGFPEPADAAALLAAGLWLLHPLFVSTTLYIVQREAMLPATFILLGLLGYLRGRELAGTRPNAGMVWMLAGIGGGTLLATLCKANGALLPLLVWALETTVLRNAFAAARNATGAWRERLRVTLLVIPSVLVLAYLASLLANATMPLDHRSWTIAQRLLTEPRVLLDYLQLLLVPRALSTGLYNDAYAVSTSLLQPTMTLVALLVVVGLVVLGFVLRRRAPVVAATLLFFFAGHAMESTTIPLELYFEHRNYIPAMLAFWPLAWGLCHVRWRTWTRIAVALVLLAICAGTTWQRAELWGHPERMAQLWALQNPESSRAQATAASFESRSGQAGRALQRLAPLARERPHDLQVVLNYANAACAANGRLTQDEVAAVAEAMRGAREGGGLVFRWLDRALDGAASGRCDGLDLSAVERWLEAAGTNPRMSIPGRRQDLLSLAGRVALLRGQHSVALARFDEALVAYPTPTAAAMQAAMLASNGHYAEALAHLDHFEWLGKSVPAAGPGMPRIHRWVLERQGYWPRELRLLRAKLRAEIEAASTEPQGASSE